MKTPNWGTDEREEPGGRRRENEPVWDGTQSPRSGSRAAAGDDARRNDDWRTRSPGSGGGTHWVGWGPSTSATEEPARRSPYSISDRSPSEWRSSPPRPGEFSGVGPRGYQRSDDRIREDVCDSLTADGCVDPRDVDVSVSGGEVTLFGTVAHRGQKRDIEAICENCAGVRDVHNNLRIRNADELRESSAGRGIETSPPSPPSTSITRPLQQQPIVRNMPDARPHA